MLPQDLVVVIANLFENAINEVANLKNKEGYIDIQIKDSPERLLIKIDNPCRANLTFDENLYGIGIRSVIATTTKYEGMYDFTAEDGVFFCQNHLEFEIKTAIYAKSDTFYDKLPTSGSFFYYNVSNINTRERSDEIDRKEICR